MKKILIPILSCLLCFALGFGFADAVLNCPIPYCPAEPDCICECSDVPECPESKIIYKCENEVQECLDLVKDYEKLRGAFDD